jgi:hypothetical protein
MHFALVLSALEIEPRSSKPRHAGEIAAARRRLPLTAAVRRRRACTRQLSDQDLTVLMQPPPPLELAAATGRWI